MDKIEYTHIAIYKDGYWYIAVVGGLRLGIHTECYKNDLPADLVEVYRDGGFRFLIRK